MKQIKELREKIDCIDSQIAFLLDQRLELVLQIMRIKKKAGVQLVDSKREKEIFKKISELPGLKNQETIQRVFSILIEQGKNMHKE